MKSHLATAFGLVTTALTVLGTVQSFLSIGSGAEWSLQKLAYFIGNAAFIVYISAVVGGIVAGMVSAVIGDDSDAMLWIWGLVTSVVAAFMIFVGTGYGYGDLDALGTAFMSFLGLAAVIGGVVAWRFFSKSEAAAIE